MCCEKHIAAAIAQTASATHPHLVISSPAYFECLAIFPIAPLISTAFRPTPLELSAFDQFLIGRSRPSLTFLQIKHPVLGYPIMGFFIASQQLGRCMQKFIKSKEYAQLLVLLAVARRETGLRQQGLAKSSVGRDLSFAIYESCKRGDRPRLVC
jgi:hypothetical protein